MTILMIEPIFMELLHQIEDNIWEIVVMTTGLMEVKGILIREEDCLMKGDIPTEIEDLQEEEDHKMMEDPPMDMEDPPDGGGPPNGNGGPPRHSNG